MIDKNNIKGRRLNITNQNKDSYGYDFVPEIAHVTNIDEQKKKAQELEKIQEKK